MSSLDVSPFSQNELSAIIRKEKPIFYKQNPTVIFFKDKMVVKYNDVGRVALFPQHYSKIFEDSV